MRTRKERIESEKLTVSDRFYHFWDDFKFSLMQGMFLAAILLLPVWIKIISYFTN